ncbi:XLF-domain-containing protein [Cucurbitaria berberidis CBS 394.84]|uniref:Non-homologous end-joining factor 1 n=1 Tax=Cucurbitaria berberidis CBS 394.84 TaxID=1168544 RepID=A0A9P4L9D4_9PLEO|nr:XLF-domain-containing protein [Cucurbitaria berberidis CBS 394.84]KAF1846262.1 XLF-domain-containing protein [Cucurbitaria berberidis CBS 394.84]
MSCWRVLELSEQPDGEHIPQLLVKPVFNLDSYIIYVTDLSNIWSEELDLQGIVDRASREQSPIEVSKQDTTQLAILLDNVKKPLESSKNSTCHITRSGEDVVILHTTITLPEPLESLTWKFHLGKRSSIILKNELILPLLVSSHIQHGRITALVSVIADKDKAITRLVNQYESSNLDLAAAFPSVGGLKVGRKGIKREQAAKHVPALQPFREVAWREETGQLEESDVTTLGLFQEALAQSTPKVPSQLKSEDRENSWWSAVPVRLSLSKSTSKGKEKKATLAAKPNNIIVDSSEEETEDEFDTHENFKTRNIPSRTVKAPEPIPSLVQNEQDGDDLDSTEDDGDLDAPPKSQSQSQTTRRPPPRAKSPTSEASSPGGSPRAVKSKGKAFRIGGKTKNTKPVSPIPDAETPPVKDDVPSSPQIDPQANMTPKKARPAFRIGGKGKALQDDSQRTVPDSTEMNSMRAIRSPIAGPSSSPRPVRAVKEETPVEEVHEETPEEKAERKRAELKRKNEEAAKKQAQHKKKRRF